MLGRHVLGQQRSRRDPALDFRLEHREDVAVDLRLIRHERAGRVQDPGIDLPPGPNLQPEGPRQVQDAVVAAVPVLEASPDLGLRRPGLEAHEGVREVVVGLVVLRREVVRLGLAFAAEELRLLLALMQVVRNRAHVVEELAEQIPAAFARHDVLSQQQIAGLLDGVAQEEARAVRLTDVAQPLVGRRARTVVGVRRRRKPPFVDAAAVAAQRVQIVGMEFQTAAGNHERARHPARLETQDAGSGANRCFNLRSRDHCWMSFLGPRTI